MIKFVVLRIFIVAGADCRCGVTVVGAYDVLLCQLCRSPLATIRISKSCNTDRHSSQKFLLLVPGRIRLLIRWLVPGGIQLVIRWPARRSLVLWPARLLVLSSETMHLEICRRSMNLVEWAHKRSWCSCECKQGGRGMGVVFYSSCGGDYLRSSVLGCKGIWGAPPIDSRRSSLGSQG